MKNTTPDPQNAPASDGPLARLLDDQGRPENPAPRPSLPQPPEATPGRDDYAEGTREHDDDRDM